MVSIIVVTLLFMTSPKLMGFDLQQQYIGLVNAVISVMILLVQTNIEETILKLRRAGRSIQLNPE